MVVVWVEVLMVMVRQRKGSDSSIVVKSRVPGVGEQGARGGGTSANAIIMHAWNKCKLLSKCARQADLLSQSHKPPPSPEFTGPSLLKPTVHHTTHTLNPPLPHTPVSATTLPASNQ